MYTFQKHHFKCRGGGKEWEDIDCDVFDDPHPMTMALSVLVTIEMLNALNRQLFELMIFVIGLVFYSVYPRINLFLKCHHGQINIFYLQLLYPCHYT